MTRQEMIAAIEAEMARRRGAAADRLNENPEKAEHEGEARTSAPDPLASTLQREPSPMQIPPHKGPVVRPDAPPNPLTMRALPGNIRLGSAQGVGSPAPTSLPQPQRPGPAQTTMPGGTAGDAGSATPAQRAALAKMLGGFLGEGLGGPLGGGLGMAAGGAYGRYIQGQPQNALSSAIDFGIGAAPGVAMKGAGAVGGMMANSPNQGRAAFGNQLEAFVNGLSPAEQAMKRMPMQNQLELDPMLNAGPAGANRAAIDTAADQTKYASSIRTDPNLADSYGFAARSAQEGGANAPSITGPGDMHGYVHAGPLGARIPMPGAAGANGFVGNQGSTARWLASFAEAARRGRQVYLIPELQQFAQEAMTGLGSSRSLSAPVAGLLGTEAP